MISYLKIKNFQSLIDLSVDFMKTTTKAKNLIVIYGENGSGKTNFAKTFYMLQESFRTMSIKENILDIINKKEKYTEYGIYNSLLNMYKNTEQIIKTYKTIDSKDNMSIELGFIIKGNKGSYYLEYNNNKLVSEKLNFVLNKNQTLLFNIGDNKTKLNDSLFKSNDYSKQFIDLLDKYWGKHSFLSILSYEMTDKNKSYISKNISSQLINVFKELKNICTKIKDKRSEYGCTNDFLLENLYSGEININEEATLDINENVLNTYFTSLYSDIKAVYYKKEMKNNIINYNLYLKKLINNQLMDIDFKLESTGTQNLLDLLPYFFAAIKGYIVVIDEIDTGIHDILMSTILSSLKDTIKGQMIITAHNTILLDKNLSKNNTYIFTLDHNSKKELIPLTEFGEREHKNLNLRKRYLSGIYGGIPYISEIDFEELSNLYKD